MKKIIAELTRALEKSDIVEKSSIADAVIARLEGSRFSWIADLPISVVHQKEKLKESEAREYLQAKHFFDEAGLSKSEYKLAELKTLCEGSRSPFQCVDLAAVEKDADMSLLQFQSKRPNDFWKRLKNVDAVRAMVGLDHVGSAECSDAAIKRELDASANGQWHVESKLRDAMRSKKENAELRSKPFVWVVIKEQGSRAGTDHTAMMLNHYFGENLVQGCGDNAAFYIGYMDELNAVSLREFYKKA
ncbi:MAG: hypothetical protein MUP09_05330 [Thiovulaceae bacterium]|nr:hypothetical protein [Sulfurimonadaceae bacterium]